MKSILSGDFPASIVAFLFFIIGTFSSDLLQLLSAPFLAIGFIFPGMAHGSLDLHVMNRCADRRIANRTLLIAYIVCVLSVILLWSFSPRLIFLLFLLNSAYHFGETDLRAVQVQGRLRNLVYGVVVLTILFVTHLEETAGYFLSFGIKMPSADPFTLTLIGLLVAGLLIASSLVYLRNNRLLDVIIVLAIGSQLPLLLAFGIYYILVHSRSAWKDLSTELALDDRSMLRLATPFTLAGCLLLVAVYLVFRTYSGLFSDPLALTVAGLAAITLPHTISMSIFYRHFSHTKPSYKA